MGPSFICRAFVRTGPAPLIAPSPLMGKPIKDTCSSAQTASRLCRFHYFFPAFYPKMRIERNIVFLLFSKHDLVCLETTQPCPNLVETSMSVTIEASRVTLSAGCLGHQSQGVLRSSVYILDGLFKANSSADSASSRGRGVSIQAGSPRGACSLAFLGYHFAIFL